jgi:predicted ATPase
VTETLIWTDQDRCLVDDDLLRVSLAETTPLMARPEINRCTAPLHAQSHGESFLALAANRFGADGLCLLDEPEAALSVTGALALLAVVVRAATSGAQFVIANQSPILLAAPAARIYELDEAGINVADYDDLPAVRLLRGFLDAPDRYLRQIMTDSEPDDG